MALDATKVAVAVTGAVSKALTSATAPTSQASTLTGFVDLGYVSEEGVTESSPGTGDAKLIKAWQNGATVRTVRTATDESPTYKFQLIETNKGAVETYYGTTVTQTATEGSLELDNTDTRPTNSYVIDVVDGADLERVYIPIGQVIETGDKVYANGEVIGYEITIEAQRDPVKGYNAKIWSTRLKT